MRADADEAVRRCAAEGIVTPHRRSTRDSHASFPVTLKVATPPSGMPLAREQAGAHETLAVTLCERSLVAMAHRGDAAAARQKLVSAQRQRHLLTHAMPQLAVQARIELTRVHPCVR